MTLPTPPRYVVLPEEVIEQAYAPDKPRRALLASFTRILSLAWESKYARTPSMNEEELMAFLRLSRRQYFEQKADMELLGWLRSTHPVPGFVQFSFSRSIVASVTKQVDEMLSAESRTADAENSTEVRKTALESELIGGGESLIKDLKTDSLPPTLKEKSSAKNRTSEFPSAVEILAQTPLLFDGAVVISKGLEGREPLDVLAWCAYAFSQKEKMAGPGGVVRNRLLENQRPPEWTKHRWRETLPEDFLEALHLITYECDVCRHIFQQRAQLDEHKKSHPLFAICERCGMKFETLELLDEHWEEKHTPVATVLEPDESVSRRLNDGKTMSPAQAWQSILGQLQLEMPRVSFETWVQHTHVARYDGNTLTVTAGNQYACDWLESRLTSTIERMLVGILNQEVRVVFVVADLVESE